MRIIGVLDLKDGLVVRGIGGRRDQYRPIISTLTSATDPVNVALAFRDQLGLRDVYLADLDAIAGGRPALAVYSAIRGLGLRLAVDAGVRNPDAALALAAAGVDTVVVGLETIHGPGALAAICAQADRSRVIFSLDLKENVPLGDVSAWQRPDAKSIALQAIELGVRRLLVLDLARVGMGGGTGTEMLCRELADEYPVVEITAGGGIRDAGDLRRMKDAGVAAVLVASALHDGRLKLQDWVGL